MEQEQQNPLCIEEATYRNILVVGSGPRAHGIRQAIDEHPDWGLRIIGFLDDCEIGYDARDPLGPIHQLADLPGLMRDRVVDEVVVAYTRSMLSDLDPVVELCAQAGVPVTLLSDFFGDHLPPPRVARFGSLTTLSFAPVHHSGFKLGVKRIIDVVGASAALVVFAPVIAATAIAIRAMSSGPVFFPQVRCGLNGRKFAMCRLRTMLIDVEERRKEFSHPNDSGGPVFEVRDGPCLTPVGRFIRRWRLDELPQFWNVLKGEMSLVGPRPPLPEETAHYEISERRRLSVRPGITCLWQVRGRSEAGCDERGKLDLEYIDTWSLTKDFGILLKTIPAVLRGTGAS